MGAGPSSSALTGRSDSRFYVKLGEAGRQRRENAKDEWFSRRLSVSSKPDHGRTTRLDDSWAEISITDFGPGIPSDKLKHVFEPFFTTKEDGMGMGLSIARTIIDVHGGRIWAENQSGGGAVFHVKLPLFKSE